MPAIKYSKVGPESYARRKQIREFATVLFLGLVCAGLTAGGLYLMYLKHKF